MSEILLLRDIKSVGIISRILTTCVLQRKLQIIIKCITIIIIIKKKLDSFSFVVEKNNNCLLFILVV